MANDKEIIPQPYVHVILAVRLGAKMYSANIEKIEKFLLEKKKTSLGAAYCMADILGVFIDLKAAASVSFSEKEMEKIECLEYKELLENVGLKVVSCYRQGLSGGKLTWSYMTFLAKDMKKAVELRDAFVKLWSAMDDFGQILNKKTWIKATKQIGKMLGYPATAIASFVKTEIEDKRGEDSLTIVGAPYKYFAHSKKYAEKEAKAYDIPIDDAVKKYAPKIYATYNK